MEQSGEEKSKMADFQDFKINLITNTAGQLVFEVEARVTDSQTGTLLHDFTGSNSIRYPNDIPSLFPVGSNREDFTRKLAELLMQRKAGII